MPDLFSKETRSKIMSAIKSKDTKIERKLRSILWQIGYRYRIHYKIIGKPDIVFPKQKIAIFCDGCFWHGCPKCYKPPKSNQKYWDTKIQKNQTRASYVNDKLKNEGWIVLRFWAHEINENLESVLKEIEENLKRE